MKNAKRELQAFFRAGCPNIGAPTTLRLPDARVDRLSKVQGYDTNMLNKVALGCAVVLLAMLLLKSNRSSGFTQGATEYKSVAVEHSINIATGEEVSGGNSGTARYNSTQLVLDDYASQGWDLVTASYWLDNGSVRGRLILRRKR